MKTTIIVCGEKGMLSASEFYGYIPKRLFAYCKSLSNKDFEENLKVNFNKFSSQSEGYELKVVSVCPLSDVPAEYLKADPDIIRLLILKYVLHNYSRNDFLSIREKILEKLHDKRKVLARLDSPSNNAEKHYNRQLISDLFCSALNTEDEIQKEICRKKEYVSGLLELIKGRYDLAFIDGQSKKAR